MEKMYNEFTAIIKRGADWYMAYCPEIPGLIGQGHTLEACRQSLRDAVGLILENRRKDGFRGVPDNAIRKIDR